MAELKPKDNLGTVADKFGRPKGGRASGLSSLISAPPVSEPTKPERPESSVDEQPVTPPAASQPEARSVRPAVRPSRGDEAPPEARSTNVTVYVAPGVKKRFEAYKHADPRRKTWDVVKDAVDANYHRLKDILDDAKYHDVGASPVSSIFPADPRRVRYIGGGTSQQQIRCTEAQLAVLHTVTKELGMKNLSTWLAPVLNDFLPGKKEKRP